MKICPSCHDQFNSPDWRCSSCGNTPELYEGIFTFINENVSDRREYKINHYAALSELEKNNFWFSSRNNLLIWALKKYFPNAINVCEVGCGTGFVLSGLNRAFSNLHLSGSELFIEGLRFAAKRVKSAKLFQMDAREMPFINEFDVMGIFDVLEHIEEDKDVLSQLYQAIVPGGGLILTVPQHNFLWSYQDEVACHVRRYSAFDLKQKVIQAGFKIIRVTSFVSLLLPLMMASRIRKRSAKEDYDAQSELRLGRISNFLLKMAMNFEIQFIQLGINFSAGGSLLLIAQKAEQFDNNN